MGRRREGKYNLKNLWVVVFWPVADGKKKKKGEGESRELPDVKTVQGC